MDLPASTKGTKGTKVIYFLIGFNELDLSKTFATTF